MGKIARGVAATSIAVGAGVATYTGLETVRPSAVESRAEKADCADRLGEVATGSIHFGVLPGSCHKYPALFVKIDRVIMNGKPVTDREYYFLPSATTFRQQHLGSLQEAKRQDETGRFNSAMAGLAVSATIAAAEIVLLSLEDEQ